MKSGKQGESRPPRRHGHHRPVDPLFVSSEPEAVSDPEGYVDGAGHARPHQAPREVREDYDRELDALYDRERQKERRQAGLDH